MDGKCSLKILLYVFVFQIICLFMFYPNCDNKPKRPRLNQSTVNYSKWWQLRGKVHALWCVGTAPSTYIWPLFSVCSSRAEEKIINESRRQLAAKQSHSWFLATNLFVWSGHCLPLMHTHTHTHVEGISIYSEQTEREREKPHISRTPRWKPVSQTQAAGTHS